jgi:hypothetical protein
MNVIKYLKCTAKLVTVVNGATVQVVPPSKRKKVILQIGCTALAATFWNVAVHFSESDAGYLFEEIYSKQVGATIYSYFKDFEIDGWYDGVLYVRNNSGEMVTVAVFIFEDD